MLFAAISMNLKYPLSRPAEHEAPFRLDISSNASVSGWRDK